MASRHENVAQLYRSNLEAFVDFAFRELHPGSKPTWHWYLDVIVDRVDAVLKGKSKRLVINAPPRTLKTLIANLALIAMYIGRNPQKQVLLITGHPPLTSELMKKLARLMGSARYRSIFPNLELRFAGTTIQTPFGGGLRTATVGQQLSGHGADLVVVDDPLSPSHAKDGKACMEVNAWFEAEVIQRLNNRAEGAIVLVMQRVGDRDLAGYLQYGSHEFEYLVLPSIATSDEKWLLADGSYRRRQRGQVLDAATDGPEQQMELWKQLGSYVYATQYLQCKAGTSDGPRQFRWQPRGDDWTPENWSRKGGLGRVTLDSMILHLAFGHQRPERLGWVDHPPFRSDEEWESAARVMVRRQREEWANGGPPGAV